MTACAVAVIGALAAGNGAAQEAPGRPHYYNPAWSPNGRQLLFESNREGEDAIYRINFDGTGLVRLTGLDASSFQPG
jgi:Tol biopolymer transport system component